MMQMIERTNTVLVYSYILIPSKNSTYKYKQIYNILKFWQHVSAVKNHHQAKIELCLGTMKVFTLWDPISFTIVRTLKVICWLILKEESLKSVS